MRVSDFRPLPSRPLTPTTAGYLPRDTSAHVSFDRNAILRDQFDRGVDRLRSVADQLREAASRQPGIRAWEVPHNAKQPLSVDDDGAYLGALGQPLPPTLDIDGIAGVLPSDGRSPEGRVVFINGVATTRGGAAAQMQRVADMTGAEVVGLYNATDGWLKDSLQTIGDRLDIGNNPAVTSLTNLILSKIRDGEPLRLAAYSQGAVIASRALQDAKEALMKQGFTQAEAEARLASIHVETFGGAASHYPDGPQYVHHINRWDPVSLFSFFAFGSEGNKLVAPGRGAEVHYFSDFTVWSHTLEVYQRNYPRA